MIDSFTYEYSTGKYYIWGEVNGNLEIQFNFLGAPSEPVVVTDYLMEGNMTFWGTPSNLQANAHTSLDITNGSDFDWTINGNNLTISANFSGEFELDVYSTKRCVSPICNNYMAGPPTFLCATWWDSRKMSANCFGYAVNVLDNIYTDYYLNDDTVEVFRANVIPYFQNDSPKTLTHLNGYGPDDDDIKDYPLNAGRVSACFGDGGGNYHFFRRETNGTWSHKAYSKVVEFDIVLKSDGQPYTVDNEEIMKMAANPSNYEVIGAYEFIGFFSSSY